MIDSALHRKLRRDRYQNMRTSSDDRFKLQRKLRRGHHQNMRALSDDRFGDASGVTVGPSFEKHARMI